MIVYSCRMNLHSVKYATVGSSNRAVSFLSFLLSSSSAAAAAAPLDEAEVLRLDRQEQLAPEDGLARVERDVEPRDARVGRGQVAVPRRPDRHRRHRLEAVLRRRQGRRTWMEWRMIYSRASMKHSVMQQLLYTGTSKGHKWGRRQSYKGRGKFNAAASR